MSESDPTMARKRRKVARREARNRILVPLIRGAVSVVSRLPVTSASRLGEALGRLGYTIAWWTRKRAQRHIAMALPALSARRRRAIALGSFRLFGGSLFEWFSICRRGIPCAMESVKEVSGWEHLEAAKKAGKGVIVITPHFGLFELMPVYVIQSGAPGSVVGRRHGDAGLESLLVDTRREMGVKTVFQNQPREMLRILRKKQVVGILPDQDLDKLPGMFLPFFGHTAWTVVGPASMSATTGAPIVPAFIYRDAPGSHRLVLHPAILPPERAGRRPDESVIREMTLDWTRVFEREIAAAPEHWAWMHERWATTPEKLERRRRRRARKQARLTRARMESDDASL